MFRISLALDNVVSNYLISGHCWGSVRNVASCSTAGSHYNHSPFLGHMTCLTYHTAQPPISGSSQAEFHSHGIFAASRQNLDEAGAHFSGPTHAHPVLSSFL